MVAHLKQSLLSQPVLLALLVLIACFVYTSDTRLDPHNGDPWYYVHAADTLRAGQGLLNGDDGNPFDYRILGKPNDPLTTFPPLYSLWLAALGGTLHSARLSNAISLWMTFILGWIFLRVYQMPVSVIVGTGIAFVWLVLPDSMRIYNSAMSESVFNPLLLAWMLVMPYVDKNRGLVAYSILSMMLGMVRYIGLPFALLGALWVLYQRGVMAALAYSAIPGFAFTWWLTRNYYLIGKLTGQSLPGAYTWKSIQDFTVIQVQWGLLVTLCGIAVFCLYQFWRRFVSSTVSSS